MKVNWSTRRCALRETNNLGSKRASRSLALSGIPSATKMRMTMKAIQSWIKTRRKKMKKKNLRRFRYSKRPIMNSSIATSIIGPHNSRFQHLA